MRIRYMAMNGTRTLYKNCLCVAIMVHILIIHLIKGKSSLGKGQAALWSKNLLHPVISYVVCKRVQVAESVQISCTRKHVKKHTKH